MISLRATSVAAIAIFSCGFARGATLSPQVENLKIWVSADTLALKDGEPVRTWPDLSGEGSDLTSAKGTSPAFVAAGPGGHPTVAFHGNTRRKPPVNSILNLPLAGEWPEMTVLFAGRKFSPSLINTADESGALISPGKSGYQLLNEPVKVPAFPPPPADAGTAEVVTITAGFDATGVMRLTSYYNGKLTGTAQDPSVTVGITFRNGMLGTKNVFGYGPFDGKISEMLLYKAVLADAQRESAERYLMVKYGLLPAGADVVAPAALIVHPIQKVSHPGVGEPVKAGLQLWARPEELPAADGAAIARWPDASGNHNDLTAEGAAAPRSSGDGIAGYPIAVLSGDKTKSPPLNQYLSMPLKGEWKQVTVFLVGDGFKPDGLFDTAPGTPNSLQAWYGGDVRFWGGDRVEAHDAFKILAQLPEKQMVEVTFKIDSDGQELNTWVNELLQQHHVSPPAALKKPFAFAGGQLGNDSKYNDHYKVRLSEVLVYDRVLSDDQRRGTEDYLSSKYGLLRLTPEAASQARSGFSLTTVHLPTTQSWVGNTFPGFVPETAPGYDWVQSGISDIMALPDGTVVASSIYDEAGKAIGFYKDGKPLPVKAGIGTGSMCADGTYLYLAVSGMSKPRAGVRRFTMDLKEALWPEFKPGDATWFSTAKPWMEEAGIVAIGDNLYVSITGSNALNVISKATGKAVGTVQCPAQPARLAVGAKATIWAALPDSVVQLSTDGALTGLKVTDVKPGGIAIDQAGHLLVADTGNRQQIITYDVSGSATREIGALGVRGGAWAGPRPGAMGPDRLFEVTALSVDGAGNVYADLASHQIRAFSPQGKQLWHVEDTCFCTVGDFDPDSDANDYFTGVDHYAYAPGEPPGQDWVWKGITYDRARYPEMALGSNAAVQLRRINGVLLRYSMTDGLQIHRKEPNSEIFVPCGAYCTLTGKDGARPKAAPAQGRYLWTDHNDDGLITADEITQPDAAAKPSQPSYNVWVDSKGGIWEPEDRQGMRYMPMKGLTKAGAPLYDFAGQVWTARPREFIAVSRCLYLPETDTMYLSGLTWDHPAKGNESWGNCGREAIRYDDWSKPTRHLVSRMTFPQNAWTLIAMWISNDAHRLYVGEMGTAVVFVYDTGSGKFIGCLEQNMKVFGRNMGWIDQSGGVRAFTRRNGETVVLAEDSYLEKTVVYRIPGH